jgi:peroxiredoxin (alkyl hydroperoxide reductase subunit C)
VLVFYPLDFTFVCPTELIGFSDRLDDFDAVPLPSCPYRQACHTTHAPHTALPTQIKCDVVGVSVDSKYTHLAWLRTPRNAGGLAPVGDHQKPFVLPLVSDLTHALSKSFGVFDEECGHSKRAVVIVSDAGVVREVLVNDDAVGRSVDEVLRLVQALQYADAHDGEACPVNWTPGTLPSAPLSPSHAFFLTPSPLHQATRPSKRTPSGARSTSTRTWTNKAINMLICFVCLFSHPAGIATTRGSRSPVAAGVPHRG